MDNKNIILALAAHPDDIEFSCGASIKKFIDGGKQIVYIVLSPCKKSLPQNSNPNKLYDELDKSVQHLGLPSKNVIKYDFPVREFPAYRQAILEEFIKLKKEYKPDLVLLPNNNDIHQDHSVVREEGKRAFKNSSILGYELPWNNFQMNQDFFIRIEKMHIDAKLQAIQEYKTQANRYYNTDDFFYNLATVRGVQINAPYAETFELIRWIE
ncbi:MAG: PIG-L family deacetylase [Bacteroidales bacterium]|nr:PIG-L family deacetylase [Bacteroidales bacterium]